MGKAGTFFLFERTQKAQLFPFSAIKPRHLMSRLNDNPALGGRGASFNGDGFSSFLFSLLPQTELPII